jgi:biotin carboxyl carrier protein
MSDRSYTPESGESFEVRRTTGGGWSVGKTGTTGEELKAEFEITRIDHSTVRLLTSENNSRKLYWVYSHGNKRILSWPGGSIELDSNEIGEGAGGGSAKLRPLKLTMPGKVVAVKVKEGETVQPEQGLIVIEAMKMENLLLASTRAKVAKIHAAVGDRLESGFILITFESAE